MTNEDNIKKWLAGELSESEKAHFERTDEFAQIDKLMKAVKHFKAPDYAVETELARLAGNKTTGKKVSLLSRLNPVWQIAALFIIVLSIAYLGYDHFYTNNHTTEQLAQFQTVTLPDASTVLLNAESTIEYSEQEWETERTVELKGNAFFKVKKGSRFTVTSPQGTVSVLGTHFAIKDWDNYYEVICYTGSVSVVTAGDSIVLKTGSAYRIINGVKEKLTVSNKQNPDWIKGESSFKSTPLSFVFKELERQYKVTVVADSIDLNQLFTGSFTNNNLKIALESITIPVDLRYDINGNKIVITLEDK